MLVLVLVPLPPLQVNAMKGVCYFNMRLAHDGAKVRGQLISSPSQPRKDNHSEEIMASVFPRYLLNRCCRFDAGQGVVQRSYTAFAARLVVDEGTGERRVFSMGETSEGVPCIEMRIRILPDGAMSKLLVQLMKACWCFCKEGNGCLSVSVDPFFTANEEHIPGKSNSRRYAYRAVFHASHIGLLVLR